MPEALEKWPVVVFSKLLPRNYEIVERINKEWLDSLRVSSPSPLASLLSLDQPLPAGGGQFRGLHSFSRSSQWGDELPSFCLE